MILIVTGVGTLIHLYSMSYMEHDERYRRFFIYLNFFIFAMLLLVLSDNFLGMFVGWEGVGLASFLLIGFWFDRRDDLYGWYADAGKKAFLVNRIGDVRRHPGHDHDLGQLGHAHLCRHQCRAPP